MEIQKRFEMGFRLMRRKALDIGGDRVILSDGLIYVYSYKDLDAGSGALAKIAHPMYPDVYLDNPMTWDTFTHIYLFDK